MQLRARELCSSSVLRGVGLAARVRLTTKPSNNLVKISVSYEGQLRCSAIHGPSGATLSTDAPIDNEGKGESFSPTDLVATALAACMATIMGISAKRHSVKLEGMTIETTKEMSTDTPRKIVALKSTITIPLP